MTQSHVPSSINRQEHVLDDFASVFDILKEFLRRLLRQHSLNRKQHNEINTNLLATDPIASKEIGKALSENNSKKKQEQKPNACVLMRSSKLKFMNDS
jgi:hypothetical protein